MGLVTDGWTAPCSGGSPAPSRSRGRADALPRPSTQEHLRGRRPPGRLPADRGALRYAKDQIRRPRPHLAQRLADAVRARWQPRIREQVRRQTATSTGLVIGTPARFGFTAAPAPPTTSACGTPPSRCHPTTQPACSTPSRPAPSSRGCAKSPPKVSPTCISAPGPPRRGADGGVHRCRVVGVRRGRFQPARRVRPPVAGPGGR